MKYKEALAQFRQDYFKKILESVNYNRYQAAKLTGLSQISIRYWVKKFNFPNPPEENYRRTRGVRELITFYCVYCNKPFYGTKGEKRRHCSRSCARRRIEALKRLNTTSRG